MRLRWFVAVALFAGINPPATEAAEPKARPNILIILSDDMGFSDLGCYGGEISTPNLDALAGQGVRFTQFYNNARCCPTRASLLTGLYPHQAGIGHMTNDRGQPGYRGTLNRESVTIAEVLRPAGYRTYMCGKWHVTAALGPNGDRATWPLGRGFEKYYGTIVGAGSYFDPGMLTRQDKLITVANDPEYKPESYYYTDALSDNAVRYLGQHATESPDKPFFLYLAYTAAHWPLHAPDAAIAPYRGKFDGGYEPDRAARLTKMKAMGLVPPSAEMSPASGAWADVPDKTWEARTKEVYAAMVTTMDAGIGRVVAELKARGQYDNTLILFLQDNGACAENQGRTEIKAQKPAKIAPLGPDDLQPRTAPPMQTRDGRWVRTGPDALAGPADTYLAYGREWANVSNTPFREYKHWTHEGGISTPLIAHWPAGIDPGRNGQFEPQPTHLIDLMATCIDLGKAAYPVEVDGHKIQPAEGKSLRPALAGDPIGRTGPIFWEHESNRAVRDGRWKLVSKADQPWELYDIDADRSELHDLSATQPERVQSLARQWQAWAERARVLPLGTWRDRDGAPTTPPANHPTVFLLKKGDHLETGDTPFIAGRPFAVEARFTVDPARPDGVVVAQGGKAIGYTLFVQKGVVRFLVRDSNGQANLSAQIPTDRATLVLGRVQVGGRVTLAVDGRELASGGIGRTIGKMPVDGLEVGRDNGGAVGPYDAPNPFAGAIESVRIEVGSP